MKTVSADWVVPVDGTPIRDGAVSIENGSIAALGTQAELGQGERFTDAVILPGFVNAHSHLEYTVYGGFGDGLPFPGWIDLHVARKRKLAFAEMEAIARLGAAECLNSGITTVGDASFSGASATACADLGLRAIVFLEVFGTSTDGLGERFEANRDRIAPSLSDRVRLGISPHAPYTCSLELYAACSALGLPLATHLAESEAERAWVEHGAGSWADFAAALAPPLGQSGIRALAEVGLLGRRMVAAHCVDVRPDEIDLLARHGVAVAHCPRSNGLLGCGIAPLADLRTAGIRVSLATDSPASAPSFDMFEEVRTAIVAARARERRPDALTAADALELATLGGARALGLEGEVGSITPGKRADLMIVSLADSSFVPIEDAVAAVVLGGSPGRVAATLVAGEERYRKGHTAWRELTDAARNARSRMLR